MQKFRTHAGYTLIEIMVVVAIIGVLSTAAFASLRNYSRHEDTRRAALAVADVLTKARTEAKTSGRMTFVLFADPGIDAVPWQAGQYAALVVDQNDTKQIDTLPDPPDGVVPFFLPNGLSPDVTSYGAHGQTVMKTTHTAPADESFEVLHTNPSSDMTKLVEGTTFPVDPVLGVPVVAFNAQGSPITISPSVPAHAAAGATSTDLGIGAGAVYLTDNSQMLLAVVVEPLGGIRTLAYDSNTDTWK